MCHSCRNDTDMVCVFKVDAVIWNAFLKWVCGSSPLQTRRLLPQIGRLLLRIGKFFSEGTEGFFRRALGLYTHKFPRMWCSFAYVSSAFALGLPRLRLSQYSRAATEGFPNCGINFKDVYCTVRGHKVYSYHRFNEDTEVYQIKAWQ